MAAATYKPCIQGWIDRGGLPALSVVKAYVVDVPWSVLQPVAGGPLATGTPLDRALQTGHAIKLRASRAGGAPANAKAIGGGPWTVLNPASGQSATVGAYWTDDYLDLYEDFQHKLAAKYDGIAELREVVMAEPATVFDEPFIQPGVSVLPGWTLAADEAAFTTMLHAHTAWKTTLQDIACNPSTVAGVAFTFVVMDRARSVFGNQCVLGNNSLRAASMGPAYDAVYAGIKARGAPIYFQTAGSAKVGDVPTMIDLAVGYGANSVELPGGYAHWPVALLEGGAARLTANPT